MIRKIAEFSVFCLCLFSSQGLLSADELNRNYAPRFDLLIRPASLARPTFAVKGSVIVPQHVDRVEVANIPWQQFVFSTDRVDLAPDAAWQLARPSSLPEAAPWKIEFSGLSSLHPPKSEASGDEIYCLNNCPPNPELISDLGSFYKVKFDLPAGFSALSFDPEFSSSIGLQFQIARFQSPVYRKTAAFSYAYVFPEGFSADEDYMSFLEGTMEKWFELLGNPGFRHVKVGVIRRGEAKGEINGSPCGNLVLFSRSALGGRVDLSGLAGLGITADDADLFRKMVIAHELAHFWFGVKYTGSDGWMVEGIPQYLGLYAVWMKNPGRVRALIKFTEHLDRMIPQDAIPGHPFGDNQVLYIKAYYQGSLALFRIGELIGHERLVKLLSSVFDKNKNPSFADFDSSFKKHFPDKYDEWLSAWRVQQ